MTNECGTGPIDELESYRVVVFDYGGEAVELLDTANRTAARKLARGATRKPEIAYATVRQGARLDVFARGKNKLRLSRSTRTR